MLDNVIDASLQGVAEVDDYDPLAAQLKRAILCKWIVFFH